MTGRAQLLQIRLSIHSACERPVSREAMPGAILTAAMRTPS